MRIQFLTHSRNPQEEFLFSSTIHSQTAGDLSLPLGNYFSALPLKHLENSTCVESWLSSFLDVLPKSGC
jgi:hypothetical protein